MSSPSLDTVPYCYPVARLIRYRIKLDREAHTSMPFPPAIRETAAKHLAPSEPAVA